MALVLVVHQPFSVNGNAYMTGDLVTLASDVSAIKANPLLVRFCTMADHPDVAE